jgi:hypothetical protein
MANITRNPCQICGKSINLRSGLHSGITCSRYCWEALVRLAEWELQQDLLRGELNG